MAIRPPADEPGDVSGDNSDGSSYTPLSRGWMIFATIASVLALLIIIGFFVWSIVRFGQAADRAEARLMVQEQLLVELDEQSERIEGQTETIQRLNRLLLEMGEDQLVLLDKIDIQTETIEKLVVEIETLQRDTLLEVTRLQFEVEVIEVPVPGEPGRTETRIVTEPIVVEEPVLVPVPAPPPPAPEPIPDHPGRPCHEFPPQAQPTRCR